VSRRLAFAIALLGAPLVVPVGGARAQEGVEGTGSVANEGHDVRSENPEAVCTATASDADCAEYWENHINWWSWDYRAGDNQAPEHRHMPPPFGFAILNFLVFAGIMYRLAGGPLRDFVRTRHTTIKKDIEDAAALHREAEQRLAEYQSKIAGLDGEIEALLAHVRAEAEAEKARIIASAEQQAERLRAEAEAQIANEVARVRRELKTEAVDAALVAATTLLAERAGSEDQTRLAERFASDLEGGKRGAPSPVTAAVRQ